MNCIDDKSKIFAKINDIFITEETIIINIANTEIHATPAHTFSVFRNNSYILVKACELQITDLLLVPVSMLRPGNKILTDKGIAKIKNIKREHSQS